MTDTYPVAMAFDPTGGSLVVLSTTDLGRWRVQDGAMLEWRPVTGGLALSPDLTAVLQVGAQYPLSFSIAPVADTASPLLLCCTENTAIFGAVWSPDGRLVAIPDQSTVPNYVGFGPFVRVWKPATGELAASLPTASGGGLVFAGDSRWIAVGTSVWCGP